MGRAWGWVALALCALAVVAGRGEARPAAPVDPAGSISAHAPPAEPGSAHEEEVAPFRIGRGVGGTPRGCAPAAGVLAATALDRLPVALRSASRPRYSTRALRDGTLSSRSTGLPPPLV